MGQYRVDIVLIEAILDFIKQLDCNFSGHGIIVLLADTLALPVVVVLHSILRNLSASKAFGDSIRFAPCHSEPVLSIRFSDMLDAVGLVHPARLETGVAL